VSLTLQLKDYARQLGFELVGVTLPQPAPGLERFHDWLDHGFAGEMGYLHSGAAARSSPEAILPGVRSIVVLGLSYHQPQVRRQPTPPLHGRVATYALGQDYHDILWGKLNEMRDWLSMQTPGSTSRGIVDTAPLLEREYARLAGLGWFGKNTMLLNKRLGSFFFVASLLTTAELEPDPPHRASHCGTCTACLDACPTQAFPEPGVLDARKCISYLTIELRQPVPLDQRAGLGEWTFGCDVCQDVCPWNHKAPAGEAHEPGDAFLDLVELLRLDAESFRRRFKPTALWRARRRGLLRNAAIVLGNRRDPLAIPALVHALEDEEPMVRAAVAWALGQFAEAQTVLRQHVAVETDPDVKREIEQALLNAR
jgi:epoxyqueuosine reductase